MLDIVCWILMGGDIARGNLGWAFMFGVLAVAVGAFADIIIEILRKRNQ